MVFKAGWSPFCLVSDLYSYTYFCCPLGICDNALMFLGSTGDSFYFYPYKCHSIKTIFPYVFKSWMYLLLPKYKSHQLVWTDRYKTVKRFSHMESWLVVRDNFCSESVPRMIKENLLFCPLAIQLITILLPLVNTPSSLASREVGRERENLSGSYWRDSHHVDKDVSGCRKHLLLSKNSLMDESLPCFTNC